MKLWLYALGMCQSMFCALPFPWHGWEETARDRMLLCLPVIGLEIGLLWWAIGLLAARLALPGLLCGALICAAPYFLTGFMHLDGFMDVTDAVRSYRSLERRREILKDSHVGSFSVIAMGLLLMMQLSACSALCSPAQLRALLLIPAVSRCCSVLAIACLPPMETSQYAQRKTHWALPLAMLTAAVGMGFWWEIRVGIALIAVAVGYALALVRAYRSLKGMNGDISGYCISLSELAGLCTMAIL